MSRQSIIQRGADALRSASSPLRWNLAEAIVISIFDNFSANREENPGVRIPQALHPLLQVASYPKTTAIARKSVTGGVLTGEYVHRHRHLSRIRELQAGRKCPELVSDPIPLPAGYDDETTKDLSLLELIELIHTRRLSYTVEDSKITVVDDAWNGELTKCTEAMRARYQVSFTVDFGGAVSENAFRSAFVQHRPDLFRDPREATEDPNLLALCDLISRNGRTHCGFPVTLNTTITDHNGIQETSEPLKILRHIASNRPNRSDIDIAFDGLPNESLWPGAARIFNIAKSYDGVATDADNARIRHAQIAGLQQAIGDMLQRGLNETPQPYEDAQSTGFRLHVFNEFIRWLDPDNASDAINAIRITDLSEIILQRFASGTYVGEGSALLVLQSVLRGFLNTTFMQAFLGDDLVTAIKMLDRDSGEQFNRACSLNCHQADAYFSPQGLCRKVANEPVENVMGILHKKMGRVVNPTTHSHYTLAELARMNEAEMATFMTQLVEFRRCPDKYSTALFHAECQRLTQQGVAVSTRYTTPQPPTDPRPGTSSHRRRPSINTTRVRTYYDGAHPDSPNAAQQRQQSLTPTSIRKRSSIELAAAMAAGHPDLLPGTVPSSAPSTPRGTRDDTASHRNTAPRISIFVEAHGDQTPPPYSPAVISENDDADADAAAETKKSGCCVIS